LQGELLHTDPAGPIAAARAASQKCENARRDA
jgi:hypothetical protein